jgi:hypothetical protein
MKSMLATVLALSLFSATLPLTAGTDDTGWSSTVNGLQARLSVVREQALNGIPLITTYLELRNRANVADVMEVPLNIGGNSIRGCRRPRQALGALELALR